MPCRCDGYPDSVPEPTVSQTEHNRALAELHRVTRLLCEAMETQKKVKFPTSIELDSWWHKHQKDDAARHEREDIEKQAQKLEAQAKALRKKLQ